MSLAVAFVRFFLGALFLAAAATKLHNPRQLHETVTDLGLSGWATTVSRIVLLTEILTAGLVLIGGRFAVIGFFIAGALLLTFAAVASSAVLRGLNVNCACFGSSGGSMSWPLVGRDVLLTAIAVGSGVIALARPVTMELSWVRVALVAPLGILAAIAIVTLEDYPLTHVSEPRE